MPRPRRVSDEQILAAARACFFEGGPLTPLSAVAARLGISQAALLHRVGTREQLLRAAIELVPPPAIARLMGGAASEAGPHEQLVEILLGHAAFLRGNAPSLIVLRGVGLEPPWFPDDGVPPPVALRGALRGWFERANAAGHVAVAAPAAVAEALLGAMEGRAFNRYLGGEDFAPGRDEDVVRALVEALVPVATETADGD